MSRFVLVTGHLGFIGKHLTKTLDEKGISWRGFDLLEGDDIRDHATVAKKLKSANTVIHLAAKTGVLGGELDPNLYQTTNVAGTFNLVNKKKLKHFIYFSSASVYGNQTPPNKETVEGKPNSVYGRTKLGGEWFVEHSGQPYTIVRPFNVYGENGRREQVLYRWADQIKAGEPISIRGDGTSKRGYTYVGDIVDGILKILEKGPTNDVYNFGSETPVSLNEVMSLFDRTTGVNYWSMSNNEIYESWADSSKARKVLGFTPDTDFKTKAKEIISCL